MADEEEVEYAVEDGAVEEVTEVVSSSEGRRELRWEAGREATWEVAAEAAVEACDRGVDSSECVPGVPGERPEPADRAERCEIVERWEDAPERTLRGLAESRGLWVVPSLSAVTGPSELSPRGSPCGSSSLSDCESTRDSSVRPSAMGSPRGAAWQPKGRGLAAQGARVGLP